MRSTPAAVKKLIASKKKEVIKLDIGCGDNKEEGFIGMDVRKFPRVDIVHDFETFPWPLPDASVTLASASHVVEHVDPHNFGFIKFMDEVWRVLKYDGQFRISTPYAGSTMFWADPTHVNGCVPQTWHYFDPMQTTKLYRQYHPKPWKIEQCFWSQDGNMEVLLSKRREDPSYLKI